MATDEQTGIDPEREYTVAEMIKLLRKAKVITSAETLRRWLNAGDIVGAETRGRQKKWYMSGEAVLSYLRAWQYI